MATSIAEGSGYFQTTNYNATPKLDSASQRLECIIRYSLEKFQFRNAVFLAERHLSHTKGTGHTDIEREYAQYLLATCHYRQGAKEIAWSVLEGCTSSRCRFLFAQCCFDLRRYIECNGVLEWLLEDTNLARCDDVMSSPNIAGNGEPDRASVLNLLGHTARAQHRHRLAKRYFQEALDLNPFLWEAFEGLCELGSPPDPNTLFTQFDAKVTNILPRSLSSFQRSRSMAMETPSYFSSKYDPGKDESSGNSYTDSLKNNANSMQGHTDSLKGRSKLLSSTLTGGGSQFSQANEQGSTEKPLQPLTALSESSERVVLRRGNSRLFTRTKSTSGNMKRPSENTLPHPTPGVPVLTRTNKSKILSKIGSSIPTMKDFFNEDQGQSQGASSTIPSPSTEAELIADEEGMRIVIDIFRILSRAYGLLSLNKLLESMKEFECLPFEHLQSGWVQCQLGKCRFGLADYAGAAKYFARARELEPNLHRDMELYSTCLWQLKKDTMLSTLAKELKDSNHQSPQAWIALGNAYSLKTDINQALKCFQRAVQLNDKFAYAHSLSGHEYTDLEEYDKAQTEFRLALSMDPRHFYAWFGMGVAYDRMGKCDLALINFREAYKVSPSNSIVQYRIGMCQEKMNRSTEALRSYEEAIKLDPINVAARYSKARVHLELGQFDEAINELEIIRHLSPDEVNVFILRGKVLRKQGKKEEALKCFTWALNIDTKSTHTTRDIMEQIQQTDNHSERYDVKVDLDV
ncbi:anaphase-promoting complex subunit cdc27 [Entomortierella beljakovae]|nr:anaphase-promoting complex subunit cdc27 [Entomortierella beljakovae]